MKDKMRLKISHGLLDYAKIKGMKSLRPIAKESELSLLGRLWKVV
jgi:hypothetical protein